MSDRHTEDGMGWGGLVASKAEREEMRRAKAINDKIATLTTELERVKAERDAALNRSESLARAVMADMGNSREPLTSAQITKLVNDFFAENRNKPPTPELIVRAVEKMHGIGVDAAREGR